jgi:hypothetical protein
MRRGMLFAVAAAALVAAPAAAAGSFGGVAVAKDVKRKSVVVVSGRSVRTVRVGAGYARVRIGQRVLVRASRRADGTYQASALRPVGRAQRIRFGAVVVKNDRTLRRLILSAGGSVFAVRSGTGGGTFAAAGGAGLAAGDRVEVAAKLTAAATWSADAKETGRAKLVELEGIFLARKGDGFDLAVVARGLVHVDVPEGAVLPNFEPGDQVRMLVLIARDGSFTYIRGTDEGERPHPKKPDHPKEGTEAQGVLAEKDPYSVTVRTQDDRRVQCAVPAGMDLSIFRVGERVKIRCVSRENREVLVKIQSNYGWVKADGSGELSVHGALAKGNGTVSVRREDGMSMSCLVPGGVDLGVFRNGEAVKLYCRLGADGFVFGALYSETASLDSDGVLRLHASGLLQERTGAPIAVRRADGSVFACNAPPDFQLSYFAVGGRVKMTCRVDGGVNTLLSVESERYSVGADGSVEVSVHGSVSATTATTVSVTAADGAVVSCSVPTGTDLSKFPVGASVKMHCHRIAGEFRLAYLKSDQAVIEIER